MFLRRKDIAYTFIDPSASSIAKLFQCFRLTEPQPQYHDVHRRRRHYFVARIQKDPSAHCTSALYEPLLVSHLLLDGVVTMVYHRHMRKEFN